jgi:crotonobetainyl-CoA:carnitine CoA-transferase CaiB-like acyl-CoA transferase
VLRDRTRQELLDRLDAADLPTAPLNDLANLVAHRQFAARGRWIEVDTPEGPVRSLAHPFNLSGLERRRTGVPALDQDGKALRHPVVRQRPASH